MPYYLIRTPQLAAASAKVTGSFKIEKIITDANAKDIENVKLYINKTQFVSEGDNNIGTTSLDGSAIVDVNNVSLVWQSRRSFPLKIMCMHESV